MAESPTNDQGANGGGAASGDPAANQRQFGLRQLYVKDLSFEAPNSPGILTEGGLEPEIKLNLRTSHRDLGREISEVVLHVSVHALAGQRTVFLVELEQAGTFLISGFPQDEARAIIGIACPNALFPYARETISSVVQRGGFAQLLLQPIDFTTLYAKAQQERANRPASPTPAGNA
ncbi:MAG: protein-export chaperone SecB [Gammaproteobacteria bacterium]|nr:protein-export chaperone SecB [Gammaproteobacteria bacterium]